MQLTGGEGKRQELGEEQRGPRRVRADGRRAGLGGASVSPGGLGKGFQ